MNRQKCDILYQITKETFATQRELAEASGHSLGVVNREVRELTEMGYLDQRMRLTKLAEDYLADKRPKNAVILAAGFGVRMVPINIETPKGLLEVKGEILIERMIRHLHEAGIWEIYIVVGFMKEQYEYLIDKYKVNLVVNSEYTVKNNLFSLKKVLQYLSKTYIIPCDIWCGYNPFNQYELYSWYMVSEEKSRESKIRVNKKMELVFTDKTTSGNKMVGIAYLDEEKASAIAKQIQKLSEDSINDNAFWEEALFSKHDMSIQARVAKVDQVVEINTYEQLREIDSNSNNLKTDAIMVIADNLGVQISDIREIQVLKKGMTNRSFLFECLGKKYIMRIPGEGTDKLINRSCEAAVYHTIDGEGIGDDNIYINPHNGYKITRYIEKSRVCDPMYENDVAKCMEKLRIFHQKEFRVAHEFRLWEQIDFYESLWEGSKSVYRDYTEVKNKVLSLKKYIDAHAEKKVLAHIDAVPDNFLFSQDEDGQERIYLIDWEYAGMQDPHIDIAMFGIYSCYDREQMDKLIQAYFLNACPNNVRIKIYCYIAACGLLWSNWCEYKRKLGVDFGEYSLRQYRYAKEYYRIVCDELGGERNKWGIQ